jgi:Gpi18-like mannosyltransferase
MPLNSDKTLMEINMLSIKKPLSPALHISLRVVFAVLFLAAIALRVSLYHIQTSDYIGFLSQWYDFIKNNGGFAAFKSDFSNYNVPYLYLLAVATYLPVSKLVAIKTLSVLFDGVLALFTYLLLNERYKGSYLPIIGALVVLFAPTIFINSAAWGQADATYAAFCLGSLYFVLKERPGWACAFFAVAISFKLQAIFFAPVLLVLILKRKLPLKYLVLIPLIFLLLLVPAFIAGRDAWSLLTIYAGQVSTGGVGGGGSGQLINQGAGGFTGGGNGPRTGSPNGGAGGFTGGGNGQPGRGTGAPNRGTGGFPTGSSNGSGFGGGNFTSASLTFNAPTFYQWLPADAGGDWKWIGTILAGAVVILIAALVWASKQKLTAPLLLKITLVFALVIPFLLPDMHERYFFLADVVSIIYAFYFPRFFFVAIIVQLCSLLSYAPYLLNTQIVGLSFVAFVVLVMSIVTLTDLVLTLYPNLRNRKVAPIAPVDDASPALADEVVSS